MYYTTTQQNLIIEIFMNKIPLYVLPHRKNRNMPETQKRISQDKYPDKLASKDVHQKNIYK